ncbi:hypothetical protein J6590_056578 [Homalodisca vitripennis]|nr:hypothetical protein J6590_098767 [Homalodisca vitripennis]KAG8320951.1 hypothetical protein J6590_056578 [Homalodisca vitripennis]
MAKRVSDFKKSKATKDKENYGTTTGSDFTSQDIFYTTESNETRPDYEYKTKRRNYFDDYYTSDTYDTKFFDKYDFNHGRGEDSYTYDDYTTSAISYDETRGKPGHFKAPPSKSEESVNRYGPRRHGRGYRSRDRREYDYFSPEEYSKKRRSKLTSTPDKYIQYPLEYEDIEYTDKGRRSHSPRRSIDYESYYYTVPEKEYDYKKYFELTKSRDKSPGKHKRAEKPGGLFEKKNKRQPSPQKRGKDYQIYAYQEANQHKAVFKGNNDITEGTSQLSEIEVKTHEYPILAFKDTNSGSIGSDTVYLPVLVMDKSIDDNSVSASKNVQPEVLTPAQLGNIQIFAANLQDQKNIFTKYGDSSEKNKVSLNKKPPEIPSGLQYAGSILGSVFDHAEFDTESTKPNFLTNTRGNRKVTELSYQVIVDVDKNTDNRKSTPNLNPFEHKEIEDPLHDDYPVTKDYIKVNDNTSEKLRSSMTGPNKHLEKRKSSSVKHPIKSSIFNKMSTKKGFREMRNSTTTSIKKPSIVESPVRNERASPIRQSTEHRQSTMLDKHASSVRQSTEHRQSTMLDKHAPSVRQSTEHRQSTMLDKHAPSVRQSTEHRQSTMLDKHAPSGRQSTEHRQSTMLGRKRGSVAVASHLEPDRRSIEVKEASAITRLSTINENKQEDQFHNILQAPAFLKTNSENRKSRVDSKIRNKQSQEITIPIVVSQASTTSIKNGERQRRSSATTPKTTSNSHKNSMIPIDPLQHFRSLDHALQKQTTNSQDLTVQQTLAHQDSRLLNKSPKISSRKMSVIKQSEIARKVSPTMSRTDTVKRDTETLKKRISITPNMLETQKLASLKSKEVVAKIKSKESIGSSAAPILTKRSKRDSQGNLRSSRVLEDIGIISEEDQDQKKELIREPTYIAGEKITAVQDLSENEPWPPPPRSNSSLRGIASALVNFSRSKSSQKPDINMKTASRQSTLASRGKSRSIKEDEKSMNRPSFLQSTEPTLTQYNKDNQLKKSETLKSSKSKTGAERKKVIRQTSKSPKVEKKKSSNIFRVFSSRSVSRGKAKNKPRESEKPSRSTSRLFGFPRLRRSKAKTRDRSLANSRDQKLASAGDGTQEIERDDSIATTKEPMTSPEVSDVEKEDLCECYVQYMHQAKKYAHFFLGTTLHEQIMNILKVLRSA